MKMLDELVSAVGNSFVEEARRAGQNIVGYTCLATPREIFDAAGLFPYRIKALGLGETEMADAYLSRFNCGFCRSCLQLGMDGSYDFLDGLVETNGCDHLRGMFENWQYASPRPFFHYLRVPHLVDGDSMQWFTEEMEQLIEALQKHFQVQIEGGELASAIAAQDRIAGKFKEIYESRWGQEVKVTGSEIMSLMVAEGSILPGDFERLLEDFAAELKTRRAMDCSARIFMGGAATDEVALIAGLEELGGLVVADHFCFSGRAFQRAAAATEPLARLAEIYLKNLLCPRMFMDYARRKAFVLEMIARSGAGGAILFHNKFCDLHGIENVKLRIDLEEAGIPVLVLEKEYGAAADMGRLRTRVQAFLERLKRKQKER